MPGTRAQLADLPPLDGERLACSIHHIFHSLVALKMLLQRGAALFVTTCNPRTVDDETVQPLLDYGAEGHAWLNMTAADQAEAIDRAPAWRSPARTSPASSDWPGPSDRWASRSSTATTCRPRQACTTASWWA